MNVGVSDDESPAEEGPLTHHPAKAHSLPSTPKYEDGLNGTISQEKKQVNNGQRVVPGSGERRASCDFCSRRKRKCDGQQPCQNCRKVSPPVEALEHRMYSTEGKHPQQACKVCT